MSIFALDRPLISSKIYEIKESTAYCSKYFSALLPLQGKVEALGDSLQQSDVLLLPPMERIEINPSENAVIGIIKFSNRFLLSSIESDEIFRAPHNSQQIINLVDCRGHLEGFLRYGDNFSGSTFSNLYFTLIDRINSIFPPVTEDLYPDTLSDKGKQIISFVNDRLLENLSLNDAAAQIGLTPQYLSSFFQKSIGKTFKEYLNQKKAELALPFIHFTDVSIDTLSAIVGFSSSAALNKAVKEACGKTFEEVRNERPSLDKENDIDPSWTAKEVGNYISFDDLLQEHSETNESQIISNSIIASASPSNFVLMSDSWHKILNIGQSMYTAESELRSQIHALQEKIGFTYGRIQDLLDLTVIHEAHGKTYYGYEIIFQILDDMIDQNLIPFITLGNRFDSSNVLDSFRILSYSDDYQTYYKKLLKMLPSFIRSCCNRYGKSKVSDWHFEICYDFATSSANRQTIWHFTNTYQKVEGIIHQYCPLAKVGGPCFSPFCSMDEIASFFKSAQNENARIDFVTYTANNVQLTKSGPTIPPNGILMRERTSNFAKEIRRHAKNVPVYVSEFSIYGHSHNYINDSIFNACFITWYLINNLDIANGFGYYRLSDIGAKSEASDRLLFGGNGVYNSIGLRKPCFYALRFLSQMGPIFLAHTNGALVCARSKFSFQILIYHCPALSAEACTDSLNDRMLSDDTYAYEPMARKNVEINITNLNPGRYLIKEYRINQSSGNLLEEYSHIDGVKDLTESDSNCFRYLSHPATSISQAYVRDDNTFHWQVTIRPLEIILLQIDFNRGESDEL